MALVVALVALVAFGAATGDAAAPIPRDVAGAGAPAAAARSADRLVIAAAGDISCQGPPNGRREPGVCQYDDTADLIAGGDLDRVLTLGDNQYETGAFDDFAAYFDSTWGRAFANLSPVPGNHEYGQDPSSRPGGYFRYFGRAVKGPKRLGFYSFDLGTCPGSPCWHLVALNSELCFAPGGCGPARGPADPGPGNVMYAWLRRDLAHHADADYPCTIAYWHHPLFSFSTGSGASGAVRPLWQLLHAASADLVLNGHSHNYQRWSPQDPDGASDPDRGIREFVVGTGGRSHYAIPPGPQPVDLQVAQADSFGVLRLVLRADGYRWAWVTAAGQPAFADHGTASCVRATP